MKLLHVISSADPAHGGAIEAARQFSAALTALGHSTEMLSLDDPAADFIQRVPFRLHAIGPAKSGYGFTPELVPWLRQNARNYDYIIVNGLWQYSSYGTWRALRTGSVPYCVFPHGMLDPWFKRTFPLKHLKKALYWPWSEYRVLRDAQVVCFTCEEERLLAKQSFRPYRCRESVVSLGIGDPAGNAEAQRESFYAAYPQLRTKRLLLFLGRIHVKKGCDLLLQAFAAVAQQNADLHLVMAGPDQQGWQATLEEMAAAAGVAERITWTGMIAGDLKWGAIHAAEAFVLPSHQENFGVANVEALACGVPVLISNRINIWREIEADGAGFVASDDLAGTTSLLQRWLALSPQERSAMQDRARQCFLTRFEITQATHVLIQTLCNHIERSKT